MSDEPPRPPSVSTGTDESGLKEVRYVWRGRPYKQYMDGDSLATYGDKIKGRLRAASAAYLVLRDGNRCTIRSGFCVMGDLPFERPESADFDHIIINKKSPDNRLKNLRLACHPCNSHQQRFQWKQNGNPTSPQERERTTQGHGQPPASSLETEKHDPQRAAWNEVIESGSIFVELRKAGCMVENSKHGEVYLVQDLAEIAVSLTVDPVFGKYSSETFMRYAREDRFDKLDMFKDKGRWWVRPRKDELINERNVTS